MAYTKYFYESECLYLKFMQFGFLLELLLAFVTAGEVIGESVLNLLASETVWKIAATLLGVLFIIGWLTLCIGLHTILGQAHPHKKKPLPREHLNRDLLASQGYSDEAIDAIMQD